MRQLVVMLSLIVALMLFALPAYAESATDFEMSDSKGNSYTLSDLLEKNPFIVIDFWSVECKPCNLWLPSLKKITDKYKDNGVRLVIISQDTSLTQSKIEPFLRSMKIDNLVLLDPELEVSDQFNVTSIPTTLIIDKDLQIRYRHSGFVTGFEKEFETKLQEIIGYKAVEIVKEQPEEKSTSSSESKPESK